MTTSQLPRCLSCPGHLWFSCFAVPRCAAGLLGAFLAGVTIATGFFHPTAYAQNNYATPYYFTTLAGSVGATGSADGTGSAARFNTPIGVAVTADGTVYVADTNNHTIRKITSYGVVTTLAGQAGIPGNPVATGTGSTARFNLPRGVAVDRRNGNVYVADTSNHAIRMITPEGVVTTFAGGTAAGAADGPGSIARLFSPNGVAVDAAGNVYVADTANSAIRKITPTGLVSTLAGLLGTFGSVDGTGSAARFSSPRGVAVDGNGNVYVADRDNNSIRKVSPAGVVTTLAGNLSFNTGSTDGTGSAARFNNPYSVAVDGSGNVYVVEGGNHTVRKITAAGVVTTLAGAPGVGVGSATDVVGSAVRFSDVQGIAVDGGGNLYVADTSNRTIRMSVFPPIFTEHPSDLNLGGLYGGGALAVVTSNVPFTRVEWWKDGVVYVPLAGTIILNFYYLGTSLAYSAFGIPIDPRASVVSAQLQLSNIQASDAGDYTVVATNMVGSTTSNVARFSFPVSTVGRLTNLSILTAIPAAGDSFTMGYVVGGSGTAGTKPLVIRAVGPSLIPLGVTGTLNDPKIELFAGATRTTENDNWGGSAAISTAMTGVGAFAFTGPTSLDAAVTTSITTADNSVKVSAAGNGTGAVIAEIYDGTPSTSFYSTTPRLVNVSVLKHLGTGLTVGFVIGGTQSKTVLIRAVGPTLGAAPFNVGGVVADPQLTLFSGSTSIGTNDNWGGTAALTAAFSQVGAFGLPAASRDAALLATLAAGNYTVQVGGVGGTTGIAIVEVYEVP